MDQGQHWIVTVDYRRAALFACRRLPGGGLHVEQLREIENQHGADHELHRPTLLSGAERRGSAGRSSARAAPSSVSFGHEVEEEQKRFARDVKDWFGRAGRELGLGAGRVTVFAASRILGLLREHLDDLDGRVDIREAELATLTPQELAGHPSVKLAFERTPTAPRR